MAVKNLGKKGIFLTFISIAIIAAIIIIFTPADISLEEDISIRTRVSNVNNYVLDLENVYFDRTLQSSGIKTVLALIRYMTEETIRTGSEVYLSDFQADFTEVLLDGKIGGTFIDDIIDPLGLEPDIIKGNTFNDWLTYIDTSADSAYNVDSNFIVNSITVTQTRPWFLDVEADITFSVTSETASWNKNVIINSEINIENFNDPYYLVKTSGSYANKIRKSATLFNEWDVSRVADFIRDGMYTHFEGSNAPNFIGKFTNDLTGSNCCGIESFVNPNNPAVSTLNVGYEDYEYWSTTPDCDADPPYLDLYLVTGLSGLSDEFPGLKVNFDSRVAYNLIADTTQTCGQP